jgi:hypothetical protein
MEEAPENGKESHILYMPMEWVNKWMHFKMFQIEVADLNVYIIYQFCFNDEPFLTSL